MISITFNIEAQTYHKSAENLQNLQKDQKIFAILVGDKLWMRANNLIFKEFKNFSSALNTFNESYVEPNVQKNLFINTVLLYLLDIANNKDLTPEELKIKFQDIDGGPLPEILIGRFIKKGHETNLDEARISQILKNAGYGLDYLARALRQADFSEKENLIILEGAINFVLKNSNETIEHIAIILRDSGFSIQNIIDTLRGIGLSDTQIQSALGNQDIAINTNATIKPNAINSNELPENTPGPLYVPNRPNFRTIRRVIPIPSGPHPGLIGALIIGILMIAIVE